MVLKQYSEKLFLQQAVEDGLQRDGSDLTGVSGCCSWEDVDGVIGVGNPTVDPQFTLLSQLTPSGLPAIPEVRQYADSMIPDI